MQAAPLSAVSPADWQAVIAGSDDAWFWHERQYSDFLLELGASRGARDLSFAIVDGSRVLGVCPVYIDDWNGVRQFGCGGEPIPFPALVRDAPSAVRERALQLYLSELARLAAAHEVQYCTLKIAALAPAHIAAALPPCNPMLRLGFAALSYATQIVDLRREEEALWRDMRKGHRADVRRTEKACETLVWDSATIDAGVFARYRDLHFKDAGRVTRSQHSFDIMMGWVRAGNAVLLEARRQGREAAFILVVTYAGGAYYGSACKDPDVNDVTPAHLLQWKAIQWLRAHGLHYYDLGLQYFGPQWFHVPGEKELGIAKYKRGFGGTAIPLHIAEHFYSPQLRTRVLNERFARYVACTQPEGVVGT